MVYQLATQQGLHGQVSNQSDGLHIQIEASESDFGLFKQALLAQAPARAIVTSQTIRQLPPVGFTQFNILLQDDAPVPRLWIPPDFSLCDDCRRDLLSPDNPRYGYPFTTCSVCGPRYSILQQLPYERCHTSMQALQPCSSCQQQYTDPTDRRFFAQTISCPQCAIQLQWYRADGQLLAQQPAEIGPQVAASLQRGETVAIKGIGGYLLLCDAREENAVQQLRQRKHRPLKPLAVMFPNLAMLQQATHISPAAAQWLQGPVAPIVLVPLSATLHQQLATHALAPGLHKLGVMLPYAPLFEWLFTFWPHPVVATSANVSGAPLFYTDDAALQGLAGIADYLLCHDRPIVVPQDDSVLSLTADDTPIWLRRSRGLAPACAFYEPDNSRSLVATGALMKSSVAMAQAGMLYCSQYLGNTDSYDAQLMYNHTLRRLQQLLRMQPTDWITDQHPQYYSHQLAASRAAAQQVPLHTVQHHAAHAAALLAEQQLLQHPQPLLIAVLDGTGYGSDGHSWGGEFFRYEKGHLQRVAHLPYFDYLLGDKMAREPRLSLLAQLPVPERYRARPFFTEQEWMLYLPMLDNYHGIRSCSAGRLFDAVACLLLQIDKQQYEGHAAMWLEAAASAYCEIHGIPAGYTWNLQHGQPDADGLWQQLLADADAGTDPAAIAARFHASWAGLVHAVAQWQGVQHIGFSGGVLQNALLVQLLQTQLQRTYQLFFHTHLPPNDENIAVGQLVFVDQALRFSAAP